MTRSSFGPAASLIAGSRSRSRRVRLGVLLASALALGACGGDDDSSSSTSSSTIAVTVLPATTLAATTTLPPETTTTTIELVTEGASVLVANASGINGAAGRLTDRLAAVGFDTLAATNSSATVSNLAVTQIYYAAAAPVNLAIAESVKSALGGGAIELLELSLPAPTESGDTGGAGVLVLMGNDVADKSLEELQGLVVPAVTSADTTETTGG